MGVDEQPAQRKPKAPSAADSSADLKATALLSPLAAMCFAFGTYFCMYAFRKPFAAASFEGLTFWSLDAKTAFVISQVLGYTASKYIGIKVVSEVSRASRWRLLLLLIAIAELALLGFALLPLPFKVAALFVNGLPLGMVWGLVVRSLEGRRTSEFLLAGLSCSFILASGAVKDVGRWLMVDWAVTEFWMPCVTGACFLLPFAALSWLLNRVPEPSLEDQKERTVRTPMDRKARRDFLRRFMPGLLLLLLVYLVLTAFRDFRDNYGIELFQELGYGDQSALFTQTELPVAFCVLVTLAGLSLVRSQRAGLVAVFGVMTAGLTMLGVSTYALTAGWITGELWMILIGLGAYLAYVPFGSFLFDRIMAATRTVGTAVFAINLADAVGYTGSVGLQLYKDVFAADASRLEFFIWVNYGLSLLGAGLLLLSAGYFIRQTARQRNGC